MALHAANVNPCRQRSPENAHRVFCAEGSGPDPYGNLVDYTYDASVEDNPFRFSTKFWNAEVGLYDYGYRYYAPEVGRWASRDSIEERGGANLYQHSFNAALNNHDALGACVVKGPYIATGDEGRDLDAYHTGKTDWDSNQANIQIVGVGLCLVVVKELEYTATIWLWDGLPTSQHPRTIAHERAHTDEYGGPEYKKVEDLQNEVMPRGLLCCSCAHAWRNYVEKLQEAYLSLASAKDNRWDEQTQREYRQGSLADGYARAAADDEGRFRTAVRDAQALLQVVQLKCGY